LAVVLAAVGGALSGEADLAGWALAVVLAGGGGLLRRWGAADARDALVAEGALAGAGAGDVVVDALAVDAELASGAPGVASAAVRVRPWVGDASAVDAELASGALAGVEALRARVLGACAIDAELTARALG
jgi:hypothetical protein